MCFSAGFLEITLFNFPRAIVMKHIIHFIILCLADLANFLDDEYVHGTCQFKEVRDVQILAEGRNGRLMGNK